MLSFFFFFFNDTATTEIYTLSLHDALPIFVSVEQSCPATFTFEPSSRSATVLIAVKTGATTTSQWLAFDTSGFNSDRKSTRLNSSHANISYAVFCLKKKKHRNNAHLTARLS